MKRKGVKAKSKDDLFNKISEIWQTIDMEYIHKLVESMPCRIQAVIDVTPNINAIATKNYCVFFNSLRINFFHKFVHIYSSLKLYINLIYIKYGFFIPIEHIILIFLHKYSQI